eukprot:PITA_08845
MPGEKLERAATEDMLGKSWERRSYLGVHPQKQGGLNFVGPHVPEPLLQKFSPSPPLLVSTLVACTGNQFCGQAIIETKARALKITEELHRTMEVPKPVRMHWTGCPNTCGQVQVADIGFMGWMTRDENKKVVEGVDIFIGGRVGADSHLGDLIHKGVPCKDVVPVVQELLIKHFGAIRKADM